MYNKYDLSALIYVSLLVSIKYNFYVQSKYVEKKKKNNELDNVCYQKPCVPVVDRSKIFDRKMVWTENNAVIIYFVILQRLLLRKKKGGVFGFSILLYDRKKRSWEPLV